MSVLSILTSVVLAGLVYGLSFLPTATLTRPDDEISLDMSDGENSTEADDTESTPDAHA